MLSRWREGDGREGKGVEKVSFTRSFPLIIVLPTLSIPQNLESPSQLVCCPNRMPSSSDHASKLHLSVSDFSLRLATNNSSSPLPSLPAFPFLAAKTPRPTACVAKRSSIVEQPVKLAKKNEE